MTVTIKDTIVSSDQTPHTARLAPGHQHVWEVSWLPGQIMDGNAATTAMILADAAAQASCTPGTGSGRTSKAGPPNSA